ncbi:MAG TPA: zf-HC2 domain-containing protein [Ktedonobacterales bacterium]
MNTSNMRGPECAKYAELLPQFRQGTLTRAEEMSLRAHLATCGYCQAQLAAYDQLDAALYTYVGRFARTAPAADDLLRLAVARVPSPPPAQMNHHRPHAQWESRRDYSMFNDPNETTYEMPTLPRSDRRPQRNTQNTRTRPVLATIAALLLIGLAATLFAVFGRPSSNPANGGAPTATTQPTATIQPTATPQPTQDTTIGVVNSGHPCSSDTSGRTSYVYIGDLKVSAVGFANAYPANELPANLDQAKPYQLPDNLPNPPNPAVNPTPWYDLTVCNTSNTTSHVIRGLTVRIASFAAYSGPLNSFLFCDGYYQPPNGVGVGGGCGGGLGADEFLRAAFAANATAGAQVTATLDSAGSAPPLPVSLGPGQMLFMALRMTLPTAPGTYTFSFGLNYDAVTSAHVSTMQPTIFDSDAVKWTGSNCTKPALLSQIPASDTTGKYVCAP